MGKFVFRLEKVGHIKHILEEQAKLLWAEANKRLVIENNELDLLKQRRADALEYGYHHLNLNLRPQLYQFIEILENKIESQKQIVIKAQEYEEQARQKWLQTRQEKEMIDRLQARRYEEYLYEEQKSEQKRLDEMKNLMPQL